ncbi:MAG: tetratricopeptide repeat protein [Candidatus Omnitrophota bacterium]|nr:tetratricopeptide repeat protein [Candidatus Omnitrophota bacterium]
MIFTLSFGIFSTACEKTASAREEETSDAVPSFGLSLQVGDARKGHPRDPEVVRQAILESEATALFKGGKFQKAIKAFESLAALYPREPIIRRYQGIAYHKLGQYVKAEEMLMKALEIDSANTAAYFYLAENNVVQGKLVEARAQYNYVIEHDSGGHYGQAAESRLELLALPLAEILPPAIEPLKRWRIEAELGYQYHGNAAFVSRSKTFSNSADKNSGMYETRVEGAYNFWNRGSLSAEASYAYTQDLYDDSLRNLNTFINTFGFSLTQVGEMFGKPLVLFFNESLSHVILDRKFFVFTNALSTTMVFEPHERLQSVAYYSYAYSEYDDNSADPTTFGRDGHSHNAGLISTIFLNSARTWRWTFGYTFRHDDPKGDNFLRDVHGARMAFHFPLSYGIRSEVGTQYSHDERPDFKATEDGSRKDDVWDITAALEKDVLENLTLRAFFTYERAQSANNSFEYTRPYGGFSLRLEL